MSTRFSSGWLLPALLMVSAATVSACGGKNAAAPPAPVASAPRASDDEARADAEARAREEDARRRREAEEEARRAAEAAAQRRATLMEMVFYDFDQSSLRPDAQTTLGRKAEILRAHPSFRIRVEGHADERGSDEYNLALGNRRALAARTYLVRAGVDGSRIDVMSYGEERPLEPGRTEQAWSRNRRAEFVVSGEPVAIRQ